MRTRTKNGPFKMAHAVTHGPVAYDREYILTGFFIGRLYRDGKAPETELPPGNSSGANG